MINFSQIYEGWRNKLVPPADMKNTIQQVSQDRLEICANCPKHSKHHNVPLRFDDHCVQCGCNLDAKTACLSCGCPENKWLPVIENADEEQKLKREI